MKKASSEKVSLLSEEVNGVCISRVCVLSITGTMQQKRAIQVFSELAMLETKTKVNTPWNQQELYIYLFGSHLN